jgi:hypothetical protein
MTGLKHRFAALVLLFALSGVQTAIAAATADVDGASPSAHIEWFEGSVEEAFAAARAQGRPLFLYWGAVWCPPCVEIKQTVFKSPRFIAQTKLFVPVYLDGDTERAQVWGERFDAKVYPTMIVFNPAGNEITRLHAGIDISAYNDVLGLSLERMRPTAELVRTALRDPAALSAADYQQLAYYAWYEGTALPEEASPELFASLSEAAAKSNPAAGARLYLQYLVATADARDEGEHGSVPPGKLEAILASPELMFASWDYLIVPKSILPALAVSAEERAALEVQWAKRMLDLRHDERLSTKNQLYGWRPWLVFHFEGDEDKARPLPEHARAAILEDGRAAAESVAGSHERQSVINTVSNVYLLAGLTDEARALLTAEIERSRTPYYFMGSLASLEEDAGHDAVALEWRRKAYEASRGPATRIRWWASYVQALTRLAPGNAAAIRDAALAVFDPAAGMDEIFSGANFRNLLRASDSLRDWGEEHDPDGAVLNAFRAELQLSCSAEAPKSMAGANCRSLLDEAASRSG